MRNRTFDDFDPTRELRRYACAGTLRELANTSSYLEELVNPSAHMRELLDPWSAVHDSIEQRERELDELIAPASHQLRTMVDEIEPQIAAMRACCEGDPSFKRLTRYAESIAQQAEAAFESVVRPHLPNVMAQIDAVGARIEQLQAVDTISLHAAFGQMERDNERLAALLRPALASRMPSGVRWFEVEHERILAQLHHVDLAQALNPLGDLLRDSFVSAERAIDEIVRVHDGFSDRAFDQFIRRYAGRDARDDDDMHADFGTRRETTGPGARRGRGSRPSLWKRCAPAPATLHCIQLAWTFEGVMRDRIAQILEAQGYTAQQVFDALPEKMRTAILEVARTRRRNHLATIGDLLACTFYTDLGVIVLHRNFWGFFASSGGSKTSFREALEALVAARNVAVHPPGPPDPESHVGVLRTRITALAAKLGLSGEIEFDDPCVEKRTLH